MMQKFSNAVIPSEAKNLIKVKRVSNPFIKVKRVSNPFY